MPYYKYRRVTAWRRLLNMLTATDRAVVAGKSQAKLLVMAEVI